jgi:Xaa-Pro aminopeptidase
VILHHATTFGPAERQLRSIARASAARQRISGWLDSGAGGLVLTGPAAVAWACGGVAPPVDRAAAVDLVWAVFTAREAWLITTNVEAERITAEYDPAAHGFAALAEVPWHAPDRFAEVAADLAGLPAADLASDGHPAFGTDASQDLVALRLALSAAEAADLADLGADAARAVQDSLAHWRPGERDFDIQARCAARLEESGADAPVLIVGGDDRLERYRHPMAVGAPVRRLVMAVAVARRSGVHVALTRFASAGPVEPAQAALHRQVAAVHDSVLAACQPGKTYGTAVESLARAYAAVGAEDGWMGHYQAGRSDSPSASSRSRPGRADRAGTASRWRPVMPSPGTRACPAARNPRTPTW